MPILSKEDKDLLNKFSDTQPALNVAGQPLEKSGIPLGDLLGAASLEFSVVCEWDFAKTGGADQTVGKIPSGAIVTGAILDVKTAATGASTVTVKVDGTAATAAASLAAPAALAVAATDPLVKATAGVVSLDFDAPATAGKATVILKCVLA